MGSVQRRLPGVLQRCGEVTAALGISDRRWLTTHVFSAVQHTHASLPSVRTAEDGIGFVAPTEDVEQDPAIHL